MGGPRGGNTYPVVEAADSFLELFAPGSDPRGNDRKLANQLKGELEDYDNSCPEDN